MIYKRLILLFTIGFSFITCQKRNNEQEFVVPSKNEINEIVQAIIKQDSLDVLIPVQWDLINPKLAKKSNSNIPPPPGINGTIELGNLLNTFVNEEKFFTSADTIAIKLQTIIQLDLKIDSVQIENNITTENIQQKIYNKTRNIKYYRFTKPIFSNDKQKAYVEMDLICRRLCGGGLEYFLLKKNNKWIVAEKRQSWIS